jgi:predicted RNase H-like HicB family nuclease
MKTLKVIVSKANKSVSAHLPEVEGYVIVRDSVAKLKKDLREGLQFHIDGLYEDERRQWMDEAYDFEYVFHDIPSLIEAYSGFINQSSLARISGINEGQMRQYVSGIKHPTRKTLERIESGLKKYANELRSVSFDHA